MKITNAALRPYVTVDYFDLFPEASPNTPVWVRARVVSARVDGNALRDQTLTIVVDDAKNLNPDMEWQPVEQPPFTIELGYVDTSVDMHGRLHIRTDDDEDFIFGGTDAPDYDVHWFFEQKPRAGSNYPLFICMSASDDAYDEYIAQYGVPSTDRYEQVIPPGGERRYRLTKRGSDIVDRMMKGA